MKKNDTGDFSVLFVEQEDERNALFQVIAGQQKPVVLILAEQTRVFQRPDDFTTLKLMKRRHDLTITFVIPHGGQGAQLALKNGFSVYLSMDQLADAIQRGHMLRQRTLTRSTVPLDGRTISPLQPLTPLPTVEHPAYKPPSNLLSESDLPVVKQETLRPGVRSAPTETFMFKSNSDLHNTASIGGDVTRSARLTPETKGQPEQIPQNLLTPKRRPPLVATAITIAVVLGLIGSFLILPRTFSSTLSSAAAPVDTSVGHVTYTSSEQLSENSNQGIADQIVIDLHGLRTPAAGKKYYAWLLGDRSQSDPITVALGALTVSQGNVHFMYPGDAQHSNLLVNTSRFLITEEDATIAPMAPSMDPATWRYSGEFSSTPIKSVQNPENFSYLDHLRHLLAADPTLDQLGLPGGLNTWLYRNTGKLVEWSTSMRETWEGTKDAGYVRRQTTRILTYLDGTTFLYRDLPAKQPLLVQERLARVGLLNVAGPNQEPPGYQAHINRHLLGLLQADATPQNLREQIDEFTVAMSNISSWLEKVRGDAQKIVKMSDAQLRQPATLNLLNDMIDNINHAFAGQLDPSTGQTLQGVSWLHEHMNALATLTIAPVKPNTTLHANQ